VVEPGRVGRRRPTSGQIARRRLVALLLLAGLAAGGVWAATAAVRSGGGDKKKAAPSTTAIASAPAAPRTYRIVFPEGFTRAEMAERITAVDKIALGKGIHPRLTASEYLHLTASSTLPGKFSGDGKKRSLEGFLFPSTYELFDRDRAARLVADQLATFKQVWAKLDLRYARSKNLTPYDVLIIASMVEAEVRVPRERPLVAAVIYNRLHARMPLGIDATIRYGLGIPPTQAIKESQLHSSSPYNTRNRPGLPPTPIGNPGLASMQAAAHPAKVDYLYFVRKADCKSHFFTASEQAFLNYPRAGLRC
jgi:UPF0755 protein